MTNKEPWTQNEILMRPPSFFCDSCAAEALSKNKELSVRTKNLDLKYLFMIEAVKSGIAALVHVNLAKVTGCSNETWLNKGSHTQYYFSLY